MAKAPEPPVSFTATGWEDYLYWAEADRAVLRRSNRLIQQSLRDPFGGIGKPEPLEACFRRLLVAPDR
jgi:toxin YoeB